MGEELGMIDPDYSSMDDYVDVEALNAFKELKEKSMNDEKAFEIVKSKARDNSRVPMHWDNSKYAGFSKVTPWLKPMDQDRINVKDELAHGEIFNYYQKLIKLRKSEKLISDGHIKMFLKDDSQIFAYERYLDDQDEKLLVFTNFYGKDHTAELPEEYQDKDVEVLINNYDEVKDGNLGKQIGLRPYEALVVKIKK